MDNSDSGQQPKRKASPINAQNARELQARSVLARKAKRLALLNPVLAVAPSMQVADPFIESEFMRARLQVELASKALIEAYKSGAPGIEIDRLSRSLATCREGERIYAGRSLPASLKSMVVKDKRTKISDLPQPE